MKSKIILSFIAIIFLSSCANKFSLKKRKYTKGYYFASSANRSTAKKETENKNLTVKDLPSKKVTVSSPETGSENIKEAEVAVFNKPETSRSKNSIQHKKTTEPVTASNDHKKDIALKPVIKPVSEKQPVSNTSKKGNSDVHLILLVILCLFPILALVAIYLHDGKSITLNFWIDLLLHFILLYWLFALLVILDVIDLG